MSFNENVKFSNVPSGILSNFIELCPESYNPLNMITISPYSKEYMQIHDSLLYSQLANEVEFHGATSDIPYYAMLFGETWRRLYKAQRILNDYREWNSIGPPRDSICDTNRNPSDRIKHSRRDVVAQPYTRLLRNRAVIGVKYSISRNILVSPLNFNYITNNRTKSFFTLIAFSTDEIWMRNETQHRKTSEKEQKMSLRCRY